MDAIEHHGLASIAVGLELHRGITASRCDPRRAHGETANDSLVGFVKIEAIDYLTCLPNRRSEMRSMFLLMSLSFVVAAGCGGVENPPDETPLDGVAGTSAKLCPQFCTPEGVACE